MISQPRLSHLRRTPSFRTTLLSTALLVFGVASGTASAQGSAKTDDEKALYAIGASVATQLANIEPLSERELDVVIEGIRDGIAGRVNADKDPGVARNRIRTFMQARQQTAAAAEKSAAAAFAATEAKKSGAKQMESGLIYTVLKAGTGASPAATDKVKVHYHGTLRDGTVFDSSVERGTPAEFPLNRVIPCWTEGVAMMKVGGKSKLVCPASIAYGDQRKGRIAPGSTLVFEVELIEIMK